jgi:glucosamine kinase
MITCYVGIDGGGTSCRARIRDHQGRLLGEANGGSANILLGVELALQSINETVSIAAKSASLDHSQFAFMHLGLALADAEHNLFKREEA